MIGHSNFQVTTKGINIGGRLFRESKDLGGFSIRVNVEVNMIRILEIRIDEDLLEKREIAEILMEKLNERSLKKLIEKLNQR